MEETISTRKSKSPPLNTLPMNDPLRPQSSSLRNLSKQAMLLLVIIVAVGAILRIIYQQGRPFVGDEVGTLIYTAEDYKHLLTHFIDPWLTMNYYTVMVKALGNLAQNNSWMLVMPSLLAGIMLIPLIASLTLRLSSQRTALLAAFFVSINPFLFFYSVQLRSYIIFVVFIFGALIFFFDWLRNFSWRNGFGCAICSLLALLMNPNAVYQLTFPGTLFLIWIIKRRIKLWRGDGFKKVASLVIPMLVSLGLAALAYAPLMTSMMTFHNKWSSSPPIPINFLPAMAELYFANGFLVLPSLLLLGLGLWRASQNNHLLMLLAIGIMTPIAAYSFAGIAAFPWAAARFLITILPLLIIFIAEGTSFIKKSSSHFFTYLAALLVLLTWLPGLHKHFMVKHNEPWIRVANQLKSQIRQAEYILPIGSVVRHQLVPYFQEERFTAVDEYVKHSSPDDSVRKLYVISMGLTLETTFPQQTFGEIQIVRYSGKTRKEIVDSLFKDLQKSLSFRISPNLVWHYKQTLQIMTALSITKERTRYTSLYFECLMRTKRQRFMPPQLLGLTKEERMYFPY